jgi:hypothetical protein
MGLLVIFNMIIPLFYLERLEAQLVLAGLMASMALMTLITATTGFSRLMGLGHIFWIPLLYFLWTHLDQIPPNDGFGIWVRSLMVINAASLVIDAVDVFRYLAGERTELVEGL